MSIATDEAEKYFPTRYWPHMEPNGDYRGKECYLDGVKSSDIQEPYEHGRTAEPTEEEVKAVADELAAWNFDVAMNSGATIHGAAADFSSRSFELLAKRVLTAARKKVADRREAEGNENGEI